MFNSLITWKHKRGNPSLYFLKYLTIYVCIEFQYCHCSIPAYNAGFRNKNIYIDGYVTKNGTTDSTERVVIILFISQRHQRWNDITDTTAVPELLFLPLNWFLVFSLQYWKRLSFAPSRLFHYVAQTSSKSCWTWSKFLYKRQGTLMCFRNKTRTQSNEYIVFIVRRSLT
jgi:hypothetical protein